MRRSGERAFSRSKQEAIPEDAGNSIPFGCSVVVLTKFAQIAQDNPMSWENENWPTAGGPANRLMDKVALGQRAFYNRTHENIYKVFCHIFHEQTKLWCSIDKWGFMRPTKDLDWIDDQGQPTKIDRPDWKRALDPHWDLNPWNYEPGTSTYLKL